jgi:protein-disulfide isomerase
MSNIRTYFQKVSHPIKNVFRSFKLSTPVAIIIAALILGGSHVAYGYIADSSSAKAPTTLFAGRPIDSSDLVEGNAKSKVTVVEYSDPECPYCVSLYPTLKQLRNEYADKVAFVYRYFPLTQIHPHSFDESKAIACAATLGGESKFYEYIDAIYGYKSANNTTQLPATGKEDLAGNIGLDKTAFTQCLANQNTANTVTTSIADGVKAGVQGTPTTFVLLKTRKGYQTIALVDGARPYDYVKAAIDQALAE